MGIRTPSCLLMVMFMACSGAGAAARPSQDEWRAVEGIFRTSDSSCRSWEEPEEECDPMANGGVDEDDDDGERCTLLPDGCFKSFASPCAQKTFAKLNDISIRRLSEGPCTEAERGPQSPWIWPSEDPELCDRVDTRCGQLPDGSLYTFTSPCDWERFNQLNDLQVYFFNRGSCRFV